MALLLLLNVVVAGWGAKAVAVDTTAEVKKKESFIVEKVCMYGGGSNNDREYANILTLRASFVFSWSSRCSCDVIEEPFVK